MALKVRQIMPLGALTLAAISCGCGARSDLAAISGRVKFKNGETIKYGTIEFSQQDSKTAKQSGARIGDGAYEIPREKGLHPGKYVVRIYSPSSLLSPGGAAAPGARPAVSKPGLQLPEERVSSAFNTESKLIVNVSDEPKQTFDFEVE